MIKIWILIAIFQQGLPYESIYVDPWIYESFQECRDAGTKLHEKYESTLTTTACRSIEFEDNNNLTVS